MARDEDGHFLVGMAELQKAAAFIISEVVPHRDAAITRHGEVMAFIVDRDRYTGFVEPKVDPVEEIERRTKRTRSKPNLPGYTASERELDREEKWHREQKAKQQQQVKDTVPTPPRAQIRVVPTPTAEAAEETARHLGYEPSNIPNIVGRPPDMSDLDARSAAIAALKARTARIEAGGTEDQPYAGTSNLGGSDITPEELQAAKKRLMQMQPRRKHANAIRRAAARRRGDPLPPDEGTIDDTSLGINGLATEHEEPE